MGLFFEMTILNNTQQTPVTLWGKGFIDKINLSHAPKILEIGCREGTLSTYAAALYPHHHFTAINSQPHEIEQTKYNHALNVNFEMADIQSINCQSHFDAIISFSHLHWIKDKKTAINNIYRCLKPGGKAYLQFFAQHGRLKNDRFLYQVAASFEWRSYFQKFSSHLYEISLSEFLFSLSNAGFVIQRIEFVEYKTLFEHPDQLHTWLSTWASQLKYLPIQKSDTFLHATVQKYLEYNNLKSQDSFLYKEYLLEVVCEKPDRCEEEKTKLTTQCLTSLLTAREIAVLKCFLQGQTAKEIANILFISAKTVEFHLSNIKHKLNCYSRSDIFQAAQQYGYVNIIF